MKKFLLTFMLIVITVFVFFINVNGLSEKTIVKIQIGTKTAYIDGAKTTLDVPPAIVNGRTLVPIRFISEGVGASVDWEGSTKTITISMDSTTYLKNEISSLENKNASLSSELNSSKSKISQLESNIKTLSNQNDELKKKISELEEELKKYISQTEQVVEMHITYEGFKPSSFTIKNGVPVKWIIYGDQVSSCTNKIIVPSLNISKSIVAGENIINFTPKTTGTIDFSCWMGMVRGKFVVS
jgi:archaellum component FlaC